jgi:hypothetical protein
MKEAESSSETSVLTRATWRNIPEDTVLDISLLRNSQSCSGVLIPSGLILPGVQRSERQCDDSLSSSDCDQNEKAVRALSQRSSSRDDNQSEE